MFTRGISRNPVPIVGEVRSEADNPSNEPADPAAAQFACTICQRVFTSKIGLGQHRRRAHSEATNEAINVMRVKKGWSVEELELLAAAEARGTLLGEKFINRYLVTQIPGRSLEAIKGARRKETYKAMVGNALSKLQQQPGVSIGSLTVMAEGVEEPEQLQTSDTSEEGPLPLAIRTLSATVSNIRGWHSEELVELASQFNNHELRPHESISNWLYKVFPPENTCVIRRLNTPIVNPNRVQRRRHEYAKVQKLWRKSQSSAVKLVLSEGDTGGDIGFDELVKHWGPFVGQPSVAVSEVPVWTLNPAVAHIWAPITIDEIQKAVLPINSAPGPDKLTVRKWRAVPASVRALMYNKVLLDGGFPASMLSSRTVFLPKGQDKSDPSNYRPISILSVATRELNKILANRIRSSNIIDARQRYFEDGCAQNIAILSAALHQARTKRRELHVVSLDVAKAFDSVSHEAIEVALTRKGFPRAFINYIKHTYNNSSTMFEHKQQCSPLFGLGRGVRQGDPLSPILFCIVVDDILATIPQEVGFPLEGALVNCVAYADDIVLLTSTVWGMQTCLRRVWEAAAKYGLKFNTRKSSALSLVPSGKEKKIKVLTDAQFSMGDDGLIPQIDTTTHWKYLGIDFTCTGATRTSHDLGVLLGRVTKAPLKPQQRLKILRTYLIPKLYHGIVLSGTTIRRLRQLDLQTRAAVRRWLRLPHDVAVGFFHSTVADGGLGIPAFATTVPALMRDRLSSLSSSTEQVVAAVGASEWATKRIQWATRLLHQDGTNLETKKRRENFWRGKLYESVDGKELKECHRTNLSTRWVDSGSYMIPGKDYVQHVHTRINCLPSAVRVSRGVRRSGRDVRCRAGCEDTETTAHIIQKCHRTHGGRVRRHNAVCHVLAAGLRQKGWTVEEEPIIPTRAGNRKPDLLCTKEDMVAVVDAQVVSGAGALNDSHKKKANYYKQNPDIRTKLIERYAVEEAKMHFTSCTVSWRGVWASSSEADLMQMGLSKKLLGSITTRVLQGSHTNWTRFNQFTGTKFRRPPAREGVG